MALSTLFSTVFTTLFVLATATQDSRLSVPQQLNHQHKPTTDWPSLIFHFTLKRSSVNIYGQKNFDMAANPVLLDNESNILYDIFATFSPLYNYTLVGGVAYLSTSIVGDSSASVPVVKCLESESEIFPPINIIVAALNEARLIPSAGTDIQCSSTNLYKVSVNGVDFAVCALGSSGFTMQSSDIDIAVEYLRDRVDIPVAVPSTTTKSECRTAASSLLSPVGTALLSGTGFNPGDSRTLEAAVDFSWSDSDSCACKSTPRPCIFIHGLGVKTEEPENQNAFDDYWGDGLANHAPCCSTMKFAVLDTENNAWTSASLQEKVCDRILAVSKSSVGSKVADTIIVTHSMGSLILAGAIATKKCRLDSSATWVGSAGPMSGSMASDFIQDSCGHASNYIIQAYTDIIGMCPVKPAVKSLSNEDGFYSSAKLNAAFAAAQKVYQTQVSALMCGVSVSGLISIFKAKFWLMHNLVDFKSEANDGMVEFESCAGGIPASKFGDTWQSRFYRTRLNHYDMTFREGDAMFDKAKMPVKWFECLL